MGIAGDLMKKEKTSTEDLVDKANEFMKSFLSILDLTSSASDWISLIYEMVSQTIPVYPVLPILASTIDAPRVENEDRERIRKNIIDGIIPSEGIHPMFLIRTLQTMRNEKPFTFKERFTAIASLLDYSFRYISTS